MTSPHRLLRFRQAGNAQPVAAGARVLLDLWLDAGAEPVGHVVELAPSPGAPTRWAYLLHDGRATGLQSTFSRQDLETRIVEHYFEDLVADERHTA